MCESLSRSAKIADSGGKWTTTCKQSTISHGQIYELIRLNPLSLTVGFDQIDGSRDKDNKSNLQSKQIHSYLTEL